jgi:hypothetical protein
VWSIMRWAVASNERAVENARAAAVDCSRAMVERAEVELFLAQLPARVVVGPQLPAVRTRGAGG